MLHKIICTVFIFLMSACLAGNGYLGIESQFEDSVEDDSEYDTSGQKVVSEDGRITIESGICPDSGTATEYWSKWTIVNDDGKTKVFTHNCTSFKSKVHSLRKHDGSVYYLVECFSKASSCDGYCWLEAYKITGDTVKQVNVIDGGESVDKSRFEVNYSIPDWFYVTNGVGNDRLFDYDVSTGYLYVPLVKDSYVLDRYDVWHFNGDCFEYLGQRPHKDLYDELRDYNRLIRYFTSKDYILRIDSLDTGGLRYASWKKPKTIADKPDVIITGGVTVKHPVPPDKIQPCDDYRFKNGQYEYIVNYCEVIVKENGLGEHHDYLLVKKDGKVILKQEKSEGLVF